MKMRNKSTVLLLVSLFFSILCGVSVLLKKEFSISTMEDAPPELSYNYHEIKVLAAKTERKNIIKYATAVGQVYSFKNAKLKSEASGIIEYLVKSGSEVKKGDILLKIKSPELSILLESAKQALIQAKKDQKRNESLLVKNSISSQEYEKGALDVLEKEYELSLAEKNFRKTNIVAPFDGIIDLNTLSEGQNISIDDDLFSIFNKNDNEKYLEFEVTPEEVQYIKLNTNLDLQSITNKNLNIEKGEVVSISSHIYSLSGTIKIHVRLNNAPFVVGDRLRVVYPISFEEKMLLVPDLAIVYNSYGEHVFIISDDNTVELKSVKTGYRNGDHVQILGGISDGDIVVTSGQYKIYPNAKVLYKIVATEDK